MERTSLWAVVAILIVAVLNTYGCNAQVDECTKTIKVSRLASNVYYYKCGWMGWWTCVGRRYYKLYTDIDTCCVGYHEVDGRCIKEDTSTTTTKPPQICGRTKFDVTKLIVGGTQADNGEYPWLVSLVRGSSHFCGGVIIDEHWILTAAHCVMSWYKNNVWNWYRVRVGEYNRFVTEGNEQTMTIDKAIPHADYSDQTSANDIALIKTTRPIVFNDYVKPICLPGANTRLAENSDVEIAGWGVTEEDLTKASQFLQKAHMKLSSLALCQRIYGSYIINNNMLCVTDGYGDRKRAACSGDSGGPLMLRSNGVTYGIGITSFGSAEGCAAGDPVVYTKVSQYITWIDEKRSN